jgi:CreA protein
MKDQTSMQEFLSMPLRFALLLACLTMFSLPAKAEEVGCVSTVWKMVGPDHKICVDAFEDPKVDGVVCHVSRARTGGISGALGLAEDTSDAAIACRQVR